MHTTVAQAVAWLDAAQGALRDRIGLGRQVPVPIVCPPFVSLVPMRGLMDRSLLRLGAQNCHWEPDGPHTGEVSATMLRDVVDYVMVGHSERRAGGETDAQIAEKVEAVTGAGLTPILFVGEEEGGAADQSEQQLRRGLSRLDLETNDALVVYEPAWAIGAESAADPEHVQHQVERLKAVLGELGADDPQVIYGGTVNDENIEDFAALDVLDGVGATRASLDVHSFLDMLDRVGGVVGPNR